MAFEAAFGRSPSFWGGGWNTWSAEIADALKQLGVPAYVYALTTLPDQAVHRFNGVIAMPQAISISESDWMDDSRSENAIERAITHFTSIEQPWVGIFVGHPTRMRYADYWDKPYYSGRTPQEPEFTDPVPDADYARATKNLAAFIGRLQEVASIVSVPEALQLPWSFRAPTEPERSHFAEQTSANLRGAVGWPIHRPGLSAENIVAKTMALADTVEVGGIMEGERPARLPRSSASSS
jgi:hypothetical protein